MKASGILSSMITLFTLVSCTSALWAEHSSSSVHRLNERSPIYVTKESLVLLPGRTLAVWHDRKLISVAAVHADCKGSYVYVDELGATLATVRHCSVFSKSPGRSNKKRKSGDVAREKWTFVCQICGMKFTSRDDLYDHIWEKHNAR